MNDPRTLVLQVEYTVSDAGYTLILNWPGGELFAISGTRRASNKDNDSLSEKIAYEIDKFGA